jgi:hypothetical protein
MNDKTLVNLLKKDIQDFICKSKRDVKTLQSNATSSFITDEVRKEYKDQITHIEHTNFKLQKIIDRY